MPQLSRLVSAVLIACGVTAAPAVAQDLAVGSQAPDFSLPGTDGKSHSLSALKGHWVVLAWFPKAFTGG
jgi:peroxiredoxin Q/BCP